MAYRLKQPIPVVPVTNLAASLKFYVEHFGYESPQSYSEDYGAAERDGMYLHFAVKESICPVMVYHYVEGVDAIHEKVKAGGVEIRSTLKDHPYGMREFTAMDPDGNFMAFSQAIE